MSLVFSIFANYYKHMFSMNLTTLKLSLFLSLLFIVPSAFSQNDTIITFDNQVLVGEVKEMNRGVITLETSYSDSDFEIEYLKIKELISERTFRFNLTNGDRLFGTISVDTTTKQLRIFDPDVGFVLIQPKDLVYLKQIDDGNVFDILNLALDIGYSFTKSNNLHQFNSTVHGNYYRKKWGLSGSLNIIQNIQDDVEPTKRSTAEMELKLFHKNDFFSSLNADYFSNNEQQIDLRSTYNISIGKYFIHTNKVYFNSSIGLAYTFENFSDTITDKQSLEGKFKVEYNMFDMGDLNMFTSISVFPSITEQGRVRAILKFTLKYDLPRDFYLKTSYDNNYDNMPAEGASNDDYVITFGIGWEL